MDPASESKETFTRFGKLLADLAKSGVDFAVVGGMAVIFNGYHRVTDDLDIIVADGPENIRKLLQVLSSWGEGWAKELKAEEFAPAEGSIRVMEDFDLDIFTRMRGNSLEDFRPQLREWNYEGATIKYLAPADLISLKQHSWRDKDRFDVVAMQEVIAREGRRSAT